jgi:hypothetical protein
MRCRFSAVAGGSPFRFRRRRSWQDPRHGWIRRGRPVIICGYRDHAHSPMDHAVASNSGHTFWIVALPFIRPVGSSIALLCSGGVQIGDIQPNNTGRYRSCARERDGRKWKWKWHGSIEPTDTWSCCHIVFLEQPHILLIQN